MVWILLTFRSQGCSLELLVDSCRFIAELRKQINKHAGETQIFARSWRARACVWGKLSFTPLELSFFHSFILSSFHYSLSSFFFSQLIDSYIWTPVHQDGRKSLSWTSAADCRPTTTPTLTLACASRLANMPTLFGKRSGQAYLIFSSYRRFAHIYPDESTRFLRHDASPYPLPPHLTRYISLVEYIPSVPAIGAGIVPRRRAAGDGVWPTHQHKSRGGWYIYYVTGEI